MTDQNASTGQELPKYYIAESYSRFRDYLRRNKLTASDRQYIAADRRERLMGLDLLPIQIVIVDDPRAPWSFWMELQAMMNRAMTRAVL